MTALGNRISRLILIAIILTAGNIAGAQGVLNKVISVDAKNQRLDNVLEILSNKGNFYFSYNSNIIRRDSTVSITANNKTVKQLLNQLFNDEYEFKESGNYIIIRRAPIKLTLVTNKAITDDKQYIVSGYVLNDATGEMIHNASIYEKKELASALTNEKGFFKIKLKSKARTAALTVSKEFYEDTTVVVEPRYNQQISITIVPIESSIEIVTIKPEDYFVPDSLRVRVQSSTGTTEYTFVKRDSTKVERTGIGRFFVSSQQKIQTINLKKFFTERPFQVSFTPGLGTHGKLSGQVVNNFSFNVLGGYAGGVNGFELGGLFNIDKRNVQYVQIGGLFNIVGGQVKGLQIGGISNTVLGGGVYGLQIGGVNNTVKGKFDGFQLGGVYNHVSDSMHGFQLGGVANFARKKASGLQLAGVANISNEGMNGVQISGVLNYAKHLKGVQIGLINISESSNGYSIGLINIVLKGYHKLSFSTNEIINTNVAFKTGNTKLYSILQAGVNVSNTDKAYTFGYGIGKAFVLGKRFSINPELTAQQLYLGSWDYANILSKAHLNFNINLGKYFSLFGGPVFNVYYSNQRTNINGYKASVPPASYRTYNYGNNVTGWIGWNAGINFF